MTKSAISDFSHQADDILNSIELMKTIIPIYINNEKGWAYYFFGNFWGEGVGSKRQE